MHQHPGLVEAVMTTLPAAGDLFQQRHIKHGFLLLGPSNHRHATASAHHIVHPEEARSAVMHHLRAPAF